MTQKVSNQLLATVPAAAGVATASGITQNTAKLLGRTTAGIGAVEEITAGSGLTLAGGTLSVVTSSPTVAASIASNAITITLNPTTLLFRDTTLTSGVFTPVANAAQISATIATTDSFGAVTASGPQRLTIVAINNAGTTELAVACLTGGASLDETGVITTATAATLATHIKSANVRTGVAYRVVGFLDASFTTAVGWGTLALVQGVLGLALTSYQGRSRHDFSGGGRVAATNYVNNTGKEMKVCVTGSNVSGANTYTVAGKTYTYASAFYAGPTSSAGAAEFTVLPGETYQVSAGFSAWVEIY